ncbi:molybdopterin converting factor subunit 1 [Thalassomonas sp. M1454]|uniref:molybdopterin converting factor subunit 1 n=1 Tax=Thalassomonas sp. M1454 TaxID=2594477 RepID=UPI00117E71BC|nr:molybdopterin converting factor subunit 1 [Thalassomonas sp. M1454]TRX53819.1 molybdopterin converting factor subunit 1 [Thalassomonas sp. M1454]
MTINVLFFAAFKEQLDCAELQIEAATVQTVADLQSMLIAKGDTWNKVLNTPSLLTAVNHTMVDSEYEIKAGDEVAFFPPVTGG